MITLLRTGLLPQRCASGPAPFTDAVDGNLLISAEAASTATAAAATSPSSATPSLQQVVNAVVAAAK